MTRSADLNRLYSLLDDLRQRVGGYRYLRTCRGRDGWPHRGVYFFFEPGEIRDDGITPRVVRVGTHALKLDSRTRLWQRLSAHRGTTAGSLPGGGNHRGSIFRFHVGTALLSRDENRYPSNIHGTWGRGGSAPRETVVAEYELEREVSAYIGGLPFLWVAVPDEPSPASDRKVIESNAIGLLSNRARVPLDPPSLGWLGHHADSAAVRESGLWNVNHVDQSYNPLFLDCLALHVGAM